MAIFDYKTIALPRFLEFECPACGKRSHGEPLAAVSLGPQSLGQSRAQVLDVHALLKCACGEVSYNRLDFLGPTFSRSETGMTLVPNSLAYSRTAIFPSPPLREIPQHVPSHVAANAQEALRCRAASAVKAACVMARRTIQNMAFEKGAARGAELRDLVAYLRQQGFINEEDEQDALLIKDLGNDGAHPAKWDPAVDEARVTDLDADFALDVLWRLLETVYTIPGRRAAVREQREKRQATDQAANPHRPNER